MIPLTKRDTAYLLRRLCVIHILSPTDMVKRIQEEGVQLTRGYILRYLDGVYFIDIHVCTSVATGVYAIYVDGVLVISQSTRAGALAYASKLCQLLFTVKEISIESDGVVIRKWVRLPQRINQWVER